VSDDRTDGTVDGRLAGREALQQAKEEWALRMGMVFGAPLGAIGYSIAGWLAIGIGCAVVLLLATAMFLIRAIVISGHQSRQADDKAGSRARLACRLGRHRWTTIPPDVQQRANKIGAQADPPAVVRGPSRPGTMLVLRRAATRG